MGGRDQGGWEWEAGNEGDAWMKEAEETWKSYPIGVEAVTEVGLS